MNGHVVYGQALFDSGRYDEAQVTFAAALGLDPENLIALRHLGDIARRGNDAPVAVDWYKRVLDADPRNQEILAFIEELKVAAAVEAVSDPQKRPSLMDMSIDLSLPADADPNVTPVTGTIFTVPPPQPASARLSAPTPRTTTTTTTPTPMLAVGDLEFGDIDFSEPAASAQMRESMAAAPAPDDSIAMNIEGPMGLETTDPLPAAEATQMDSSLGWEMPGDINLDAAAAETGSAPDESAPVGDTPQVFVTETMAELYLQQGFRDEAVQVYRQLAELNPHDRSLQDRIKNLEGGGRGSVSLDVVSADVPDFAPGTGSLVPMSEEQPAEQPVVPIETLAPTIVSARAFFAALAARRATRADGSVPGNGVAAPTPVATPVVSSTGGSIDGLFGGSGATAGGGTSDDAIGLALATAVGQGEAGAAIRGKPTTAAASELSLDSVFRGDSTMRASGPVNRQSSVLKFDQFFAPDAGAAPTDPAGAVTPPAAATDAPPADDAQFQSWLQGLKGK